jgi:hypothetical protein
MAHGFSPTNAVFDPIQGALTAPDDDLGEPVGKETCRAE